MSIYKGKQLIAGGGVADAFTPSTLKGGENVEIKKKVNPYVIDEHTLALWHFDDSINESLNNVEPYYSSYGNLNITSDQQKFGAKSAGGSGRDNIFQVSTNSYSSSNLTIDFWLYPGQYQNQYKVLFGTRSTSMSGGNGLRISYENNASICTITLIAGGNSISSFSDNGILTRGIWHHIVYELRTIERKIYVFIDGSLINEIDLTSQINLSSCNAVWIEKGYYGYIDEVRVSDVIRWYPEDAPFDVPTAAYERAETEDYYVIDAKVPQGSYTESNLVPSGGNVHFTKDAQTGVTSVSVDGSDVPENVWTQDNLIAGNNVTITEVQQPASYENTIVLCHLDDNLKDEVSGNNISNYITSIEYTEGKFNKGVTSSSYDSYLQFRDENNLITGNYTVDFWLYPKIEMYPNGYLYISHHSSTGYQIRLRENVFSLGSYVTGTGTKITNASYPSGVSFTLNTWHHFAYVNDDTNSKVYVFLDGNLIHSATRTYQDEGIYQVACVGYKNKKPIIFDEIRVSNVARYTSNFTPESTPYQQSETSPKYQINSTASGGGAPTLTWYTGNTGTTVTIADTSSAALVKVYKNGLLLQPIGDYAITGTTLTLVTALLSTDKVAVEVF